MNTVLPVKAGGAFAYQIVIEDSFDGIIQALEPLDLTERRICIVTDDTVEKLYAPELTQLLSTCCRQVFLYSFPAGEKSKNVEQIQEMYRFFLECGLDRSDVLVALGGGVTGDMTGYAAATYLRGIRFIQVPTTLLAQVDSSIGGKTGVDFEGYKNMIGAFYMPSLVYINIRTLETLSDEQFACGMGEVLKHGLIRDASYYEWTIENMFEIQAREPQILMQMVRRSCEIKRSVVEKDPTEKGERALLNFGHTIGHAIEKLKDFTMLHGQCVSLGMVAAARISWKRGLIDDGEFYEIRDMNVGFELPISFDGLKAEDILAATKKDKKMNGNHVKFILLKKIGKAFIDETVTDEEMLEAIRSMDAELWANE